jgi:uncharacterized Zn finger protein
MKVECKIQGCALEPFLFVMLIDYLFQDMFLNWYSQLILKTIFRRSLATPNLSASIVHGTYSESDFCSVYGQLS